MFAVNIWLMILPFTLVSLRQAFAERNVNIAARIVGGSETTIEEYPYAVSIRNTFYAGKYEKNVCCGSIISEDWVLTSAHCVNGFKQNCSHLAVRVGKTNNNQGKIHYVSDVVVHPSYTYSRVPGHNIGILKVSTPFLFSIRIQPVKIASKDFVLVSGGMATVVGWGASEEGGNDFVNLRQVSVPIMTREECARYFTDYEDYDGSGVITDDVFCAGLQEGGKGFCENDNGGPLVYNSTQVGVVSWSAGCADEDYPGVYTNVSYFSDWISSMTGIGLHVSGSNLAPSQGTNGVPTPEVFRYTVVLLPIHLLAVLTTVNVFQLLL